MDDTSSPISIDDDADWLTEQMQAVKDLSQDDEVSEGRKYDISIRWGTALAGRLPRLVHYSARGLLNEADERRFQILCDELRGMSDLIERIWLVQPSFIESPPAKARRHRAPKPSTSRRGLRLRRG